MSSPALDITTRLSDLVETAEKEGPQVLTKDGVETAVLISIEDWKHIKSGQLWKLPPDPIRRSLEEILLDPNGPHDLDIPPQGRLRLRDPIEFK